MTATLARKLDACAAYATQLPYQFGGPGPMRQRLTDLARADARRAGLPVGRAAERFHVDRSE